MKARAIALVVPLALGTACTHAGQTAGTSPSSGERQAAAGATGSAPAGRDPLMRPGLAIQGHGEDRIVAGRIAATTGSEVTIQTPQGDRRTLQIVPETMIQLDGQDAASEDLAAGQAIRASFDDVDGQEVAVKIRAGGSEAAASDATTDQGTGSSATDQGTGSSSGDQGTGSPSPDGSNPGNETPDAGWGPPGSSGNPAPPASPHW